MSKLTDKKCKAATSTKGSTKLFDGRGLYLDVRNNGSKYWRYKYRSPLTQKETVIALGVYPETTLAEAREKHSTAHKQVKEGIDPQQHKRDREEQKRKEAENTYKAMALQWYEHKKPEWSEGNAKTVIDRLEKNVFPVIGDIPVKDLTHSMLLDLAQDIRKRGANELAKRIIQQSRHILQYAVLRGHVDRNIAVDLKGVITAKRKSHYAAIDTKDLPEFVKELRSNKARLHRQTYLAVEFIMRTFVRTNEMIKAEWSEFDLKENMWIIPAHRMKMKKEHMVPLSTQVIDILDELKELHA